jgi:hypothetical protein
MLSRVPPRFACPACGCVMLAHRFPVGLIFIWAAGGQPERIRRKRIDDVHLVSSSHDGLEALRFPRLFLFGLTSEFGWKDWCPSN